MLSGISQHGELGESAARGNLRLKLRPHFFAVGKTRQREPPTVAAAKLTSRNTVERYLICLIDPWGKSRPQPGGLNAYLFGPLLARRRATKKAWLGGPKFGPQNWVPNLDPKFGPQTLPQLGHCLEKKDRDPFSGPCLGSENGANFAQVGVWVQKRAAKRKLANLPQTANISPLGV